MVCCFFGVLSYCVVMFDEVVVGNFLEYWGVFVDELVVVGFVECVLVGGFVGEVDFVVDYCGLFVEWIGYVEFVGGSVEVGGVDWVGGGFCGYFVEGFYFVFEDF